MIKTNACIQPVSDIIPKKWPTDRHADTRTKSQVSSKTAKPTKTEKELLTGLFPLRSISPGVQAITMRPAGVAHRHYHAG